jgi:hypothetical protein
MRVDFRAEQRMWLHVPPAFPSGPHATGEQWEADVLARYLEGRPDAGDDEIDAVRTLLRNARRDLLPSAAFGLQFWPVSAPVAVLVSVEIAPPLRASDDPVNELLGDIALAHPPSIDRAAVDGIGEGITARFVGRSDDRQEPPAGLGYVLSGDRCSVRIMTAPTTTTMVGLIERPLREVVMTMQVVDG